MTVSLLVLLFVLLAPPAFAQGPVTVTKRSEKVPADVLQRVRVNPGDSQAIEDGLEIGFNLVAAGRYQESLEFFSAVKTARPTEHRAMYGGALASFNLGQLPAAEEQVRAALKVLANATNTSATTKYGKADALVLLGVILAVKGDNDAALAVVSEAVSLAPGSFDAQFALGRALYGTGDPRKAAVAFERAVALKPEEARSRFFLATALEASGDYDKAQKAYLDLIGLYPARTEGHLGLGVLLVKLGGENTERGIQELQKAVSLSGDSYEAQVNLGRAQVKVGRYREAVENLKRAAELDPNNPEPHYQLAIAYRRLGMKAEADQAAARVKEINSRRRPNNVNLLDRKPPQ